MVLWGRPPPRGYLSVSSVPPEEHGIEGLVPRPPGGPLCGPAQPPVQFPHQGEGLLPQRVRDRAPVPVPWPALLRPPCRPPSLPLRLRRRCRAPSPLRRGHPRRLRPRRGGGLLVLVSWGFGGDERAGVRVDVVEVVVVVVVVVVCVVCRHLLDAGGDAPHRLHVRLRGRSALCPPPFAPPSSLGSHAPPRLSLGARGALALALGSLSRHPPVSRVPPPFPHAFARSLSHPPSSCPLHLGSLPAPLREGHGKAGLHGVGSKGQGAAGQKGKGQGKEGGHGYMGSAVIPGKGMGWWGGVVPPAIAPVIPPFPPPPYPAMGMMYPPPPAYPGVPAQAHVQQRPQAGGTTWGAQGGKREEHRRAWERVGEAERSLPEREAGVMGGADRVAEGRTEGTGRPQGGEAQAVEELQWAWADLRRRQERVERAERGGRRHVEGGGPEGCPPLVPFKQPAIPPEQESVMQERAWRRIRGEVARLAERDREVAARERRVREEEEAVARGAHRVLPDLEGDGPSTDVEGRSQSGKRAREEEEGAGKERGKQHRMEERGAGGAEGAPQPASSSPEPTPTDWDSESPPPRRYAPPPLRRGPGTVTGWTAGVVAELVGYMKWAGRTRGRRERRGTHSFSDLVGRAGRPGERGPEMEEGRWRRMLGKALPGVSLDCPQEKGKKPRVWMRRELLQREGWYGGEA